MEIEKGNKVRRNGFTTIEVISILVILGILSAVAISKVASTATYSLVAEADVLRMHLRYAQYRALSDDVSWGMSFTGNTYTLLRGATATYNLPNDSSATHTLANGISFSPTPGGVSFDEWGSPGTADITITLSSSGGSQSIPITKNTGFIP